ncbi:hypothetical protein UlMin_040941 [Ulmus minor]
MYNTYITTSTLYSIRTKGSLSFSFNDYSYLLNERFYRNPVHNSLSSCVCCECCGFSIRRVPINPCYLYGPRQSKLLQWSASRKLILGPNYGVDRCCYDVPCCVKERSVCEIGRRSRERCCCNGRRGNGEGYDSKCVDDAEALLSLLSEEVDEECIGGRRRNEVSYRRVEVKGKGRLGWRGRNVGSCEKVEVEKRGNYGSKCDAGKKKNGGSRSLESNSNREFKSVKIESRDEDLRRSEETGVLSRGDNRRLRKDGSSSSYYSFSSAGDIDSEMEVQDKYPQVAEESLNEYEGSGWEAEGSFGGQVITKQESHATDFEGHEEVTDRRTIAVAGGVGWDRKKFERKPIDTSGEELQQPGRESSKRYGRTSSTYKQFSDKEETSTLSGNLDKGTRKQYDQSQSQVSVSRRKFPESKDMPAVRRDDAATTSHSGNTLDGRGKNQEITAHLVGEAKNEQRNTVSYADEKDNISRKTEDLRKTSEVQDFETERTYIPQNQSEIRITGVEEDVEVLGSLQETEWPRHQTSQQTIRNANVRRRSQQSTEISEAYKSDTQKTSIRQSETSYLRVENTNLGSISRPGSMKPYSQDRRNAHQRIQSSRGSDDVTDVSVVHGSDVGRVTDSQRTSAKRVLKKSNTISIGESAGETREGNNQTGEKFRQVKPGEELGETSAPQAPLSLDFQSQVQQDDAKERGDSSSQTILVPPTSQLVARSSLQLGLASGIESQKISWTTSESGSSALYLSSQSQGQSPALHQESYERNESTGTRGEPLYLINPEDAMGSADRFQQSSSHYVGEFLEKARHEIASSEIQAVKDDSETKLGSKDDRSMQKTSSQLSSEDLRLKEETRRSSRGSGTKGPSDEMWLVSDPSTLKAPEEEETEATATIENSTAKRSGRSVWNAIADIVLLRWGSHCETPSSATRSGRRVSSYRSAGSESCFSTHETEQTKDKRAKDKGLQPDIASDQLQQTILSPKGQGEVSDTLETAEKVKDLETEPSSSTYMVGSGSTSKAVSLSGDEHLDWNEDEKSSQGTPGGIAMVESSSQPAARGESFTIVSEISNTRNNNGSKNGLEEQTGQSDLAKLNEGSGTEGNAGELKRRKLQRNKQVPKDRFDEWEEAYILESEQRKMDEMFMREALIEAKKAADTWEVPVGAVLVQHGKIIARGYNLVEELRDSTAHAEMICIREASNVLRSWRLADTTLYVTLEPCPMCAGAILQARITNLVWGAPNKLLGADGSWIRLFPDGDRGNNSEPSDKPAAPVHPFHPNMNIRRGILASDCAEVMQQFFQLRRKKKEKQAEASPSSRLSSSHPSKLLKKVHDVFHIMFCL